MGLSGSRILDSCNFLIPSSKEELRVGPEDEQEIARDFSRGYRPNDLVPSDR